MTDDAGNEYFLKSAAVEVDWSSPHDCPVCGQTEFSVDGSYEICTICWWKDDPVQLKDPNLSGGANKLSLIEAQNVWAATGKPIP